MTNLDKLRTEREARHGQADRGHATRYSEAIDRYLGAVGYRSEEPVRPDPVTGPSQATKARGIVLLGADDSPASYIAADHAAIEAELRGWELRIVHVQRPGAIRPPSRDAGADLLRRLTERVHAHSPTVPVTSRLLVGSAPPLLLAEAREAGLVVVGHRHGRAGAVFGISIGDRVAASHTGVVLVVRIPGWPPGPGFGTRPVVVGVDRDGSPAVDFAHREAEVRGSDLVILRAGSTPRTPRMETVGGVRVHRRFLAEDPAAALIDASNEAAALVIGRHGPGGITAGLLGSVSRSVVQRAHCPVFLVG